MTALRKPTAPSRRTPEYRRRRALALGVITLVILAVGGEISLRALSGLPWESYYYVSVQVPNAERLIANDDVRIGGVRVGQVAKVTAEPGRDGAAPFATIKLQLSPSVGRLPLDTTVEVRPASVLGATYVALTLGHSHQTLAPDATLPLRNGSNSVDVTDFLQIFKGSAAKNFQSSTADFAGGVAGEGSSLGATFGSLATLMLPLTDVAQALAARPAQLARFVDGSNSAFSALAPVSEQLRGLLAGGASTFGAMAAVRPALGQAIADAPASETSGTVALRRALPGLTSLAAALTALRPATPLLSPSLRLLDQTFGAGTVALTELPPFSRDLRTTLSVLGRVAQLPSTTGTLRKLAEIALAGRRAIDPLETAQTHCNVFSLFAVAQASAVGTIGVGDGPAMLNTPIDNKGNSTDMFQSAKPAPNAHVNYSPEENATECAAGNEPDNGTNQVLTNPTGLPDKTRMTTPAPGVLKEAASVGLLAKLYK